MIAYIILAVIISLAIWLAMVTIGHEKPKPKPTPITIQAVMQEYGFSEGDVEDVKLLELQKILGRAYFHFAKLKGTFRNEPIYVVIDKMADSSPFAPQLSYPRIISIYLSGEPLEGGVLKAMKWLIAIVRAPDL